MTIAFLLAGLSSAQSAGADRPLNVCMEDGFWAPYTFLYDGKPQGVHVEMVTQAAEQSGLMLTIQSMPWKRCLEAARSGGADAILSAAYTEDRTEYLDYPADAKATGTSSSRITEVQYVIVTRKGSGFRWQGDLSAVPQPVGVPMGYSTVGRLIAAGIAVTEGLRYDDLFEMLRRGRVNALAFDNDLVNFYLRQEKYASFLEKHSPPYESRSMYFPFSKETSSTTDQKIKFWEALSKLREDAEAMKQIWTKANTMVDKCLETQDHCH